MHQAPVHLVSTRAPAVGEHRDYPTEEEHEYLDGQEGRDGDRRGRSSQELPQGSRPLQRRPDFGLLMVARRRRRRSLAVEFVDLSSAGSIAPRTDVRRPTAENDRADVHPAAEVAPGDALPVLSDTEME